MISFFVTTVYKLDFKKIHVFDSFLFFDIDYENNLDTVAGENGADEVDENDEDFILPNFNMPHSIFLDANKLIFSQLIFLYIKFTDIIIPPPKD
jgi:hypothetical protein